MELKMTLKEFYDSEYVEKAEPIGSVRQLCNQVFVKYKNNEINVLPLNVKYYKLKDSASQYNITISDYGAYLVQGEILSIYEIESLSNNEYIPLKLDLIKTRMDIFHTPIDLLMISEIAFHNDAKTIDKKLFYKHNLIVTMMAQWNG